LLLTLKGRKVVGGAIVEHFEEAGAPEALVDRYKSLFLEAIARQSLRHPQNIGFCYCCDCVKKITVPTQLGTLALVKDEDTLAMAVHVLFKWLANVRRQTASVFYKRRLNICRELPKSPFNASTTLSFDSNLQFRGQRLANSAILSALLASHRGRMWYLY
jgi:hypothetical protein